MKVMKLLGLVVILGMLGAMLAACGPEGTPVNTVNAAVDNTDEFEVVRAAADAFLASGKAEQMLLSADLHEAINDADPDNDPRIMDTRNNNTFIVGHICNAMSVPWHQIFLTLTPGKFADTYFADRDARSANHQVVIVSYTGQEGAGLNLAAINMLGLDAVQLKWGYNQWQFCPNASPGTFFPAATGLGRVTGLNKSGDAVIGFWAIGENYPTETTPHQLTQTYAFPVINNSTSGDTFDIIRAAANKVAQKETPLSEAEKAEGGAEQKHKWWPTEIIPVDLFSAMNGGAQPFILSVQPRELYDKGHIPGAAWMDIKTLCQPENLKLLPTDRQIVVVSNDGMTGTTVSAILNMLGYDSVNLLFGMMAWTYSDEVVTGRWHTYEEDMTTFKDVLSYEICWIDIPSGNVLPPIGDWEKPILAESDVPEF